MDTLSFFAIFDYEIISFEREIAVVAESQNCLCGYYLTALEVSPLKKIFKIILKVLCLVSSTAVHFPRCCVTDKNKFLNIIWEPNF